MLATCLRPKKCVHAELFSLFRFATLCALLKYILFSTKELIMYGISIKLITLHPPRAEKKKKNFQKILKFIFTITRSLHSTHWSDVCFSLPQTLVFSFNLNLRNALNDWLNQIGFLVTCVWPDSAFD